MCLFFACILSPFAVFEFILCPLTSFWNLMLNSFFFFWSSCKGYNLFDTGGGGGIPVIYLLDHYWLYHNVSNCLDLL